jgi:Collagen triple helix repeat (20 copies)
MFSAIRKHISPTTVVAFMALVFAMTGGAFAASNGSGSGGRGAKATASTTPLASAAKSKAKPKAGPRGPAGPKGATGATGAAGPVGATGPTGATGPAGPQGPAGTNGTNGTNGENGKEGAKGKEGPEGTFGGQTLPPGKTLKGHWAASGFGEAGYPEATSGVAAGAVSYALPLGALPAEHYIPEGVTVLPSGCTGSVIDPGAEPGNLCVFAESEFNVSEKGRGISGESGVNGFTTNGFTAEKGRIVMSGTWAVTEAE